MGASRYGRRLRPKETPTIDDKLSTTRSQELIDQMLELRAQELMDESAVLLGRLAALAEQRRALMKEARRLKALRFKRRKS